MNQILNVSSFKIAVKITRKREELNFVTKSEKVLSKYLPYPIVHNINNFSNEIPIFGKNKDIIIHPSHPTAMGEGSQVENWPLQIFWECSQVSPGSFFIFHSFLVGEAPFASDFTWPEEAVAKDNTLKEFPKEKKVGFKPYFCEISRKENKNN